MSEFTQASDTISRLAIQYEGMVFAAKVLSEIGSLEQHLSELRRERDTLLAKNADARATQEKADDAFSSRTVDHQLEVSQWQEDREERESACTAQVEAALVSAKATAATIVQNATNDAVNIRLSQDKMVADAQGEIAMLHTVREQLEIDTVSMREILKALLDQRQQLLNYLDTMRSMPVDAK